MDDLVDLVRTAGAREIMPRFRNLSGHEVQAKEHARDLVTIADRGAEDLIMQQVRKILPDAAVVGEEAVSANPAIIDAIGTTDLCVVVDPIDGTGNYVAGLSVFGTILAVTYRGQTVFGLLYDPVVDDWMFACRSEGAWFRRRDGDIVRVGTRGDRDLAAVAGYLALQEYDPKDRETVVRGFSDAFHIRDIRCSCHEYRLLASGGVDFLRSFTLKPWDHAAGLLLVEEAGGWSEVDFAVPYVPTLRNGRVIAASCEAMGRRISRLAAALP
jgi:fructose-1,6-bisphosphatase/inositol monophosphatase family enzyme